MAVSKRMTTDVLTLAIMTGIMADLPAEARERVATTIRVTIDGALTQPHDEEVNPENPALIQFRNQWHTLCALAFLKLGVTSIELTIDDLKPEAGAPRALVLHAHPNSLELKLMTMDEADTLRQAVESRGGVTL